MRFGGSHVDYKGDPWDKATPILWIGQAVGTSQVASLILSPDCQSVSEMYQACKLFVLSTSRANRLYT